MTESERNKRPIISIVVCTRNRAAMLRNALDSLLQLEENNAFGHEILIVDNGSTDGTRDVVLPFTQREDHVRYVHEPNLGVAYARNRGVRDAEGEWIAFFDDDQLAEPNWLSELFGMAVAKNVLCAGGRVQLKLPESATRDLGPVCRDLLSETVNQPHSRMYSRRFKPGAGNLLLHRTLIEEVGGFSPDYNDRGEDTILFLKIHKAGHQSWYTPNAVVHHCIPADRLTDDAFLDLTRRVGMRMPAYEKDYWKLLFPVAWSARIAQTVCVFTPRWIVAQVSGNRDRKLEANCEMLMATTRIRHGAKWLLAGDPLLTS